MSGESEAAVGTATVIPYVHDHFLLGQRAELNGRRVSYREQVRLEAVPEAAECVGCASGSVLRRRKAG